MTSSKARLGRKVASELQASGLRKLPKSAPSYTVLHRPDGSLRSITPSRGAHPSTSPARIEDPKTHISSGAPTTRCKGIGQTSGETLPPPP